MLKNKKNLEFLEAPVDCEALSYSLFSLYLNPALPTNEPFSHFFYLDE